jgi:hypothetical protein
MKGNKNKITEKLNPAHSLPCASSTGDQPTACRPSPGVKTWPGWENWPGRLSFGPHSVQPMVSGGGIREVRLGFNPNRHSLPHLRRSCAMSSPLLDLIPIHVTTAALLHLAGAARWRRFPSLLSTTSATPFPIPDGAHGRSGKSQAPGW